MKLGEDIHFVYRHSACALWLDPCFRFLFPASFSSELLGFYILSQSVIQDLLKSTVTVIIF